MKLLPIKGPFSVKLISYKASKMVTFYEAFSYIVVETNNFSMKLLPIKGYFLMNLLPIKPNFGELKKFNAKR